MTQLLTIYVRLLDEGVNCWRPVDAIMVKPGVFRIVSSPPDPDDERWEFRHGQHVACETRSFQDGGKQLVAVHAVSSAG